MSYADTIVKSLNDLVKTTGKEPYRTALGSMGFPTYFSTKYTPTVSKKMVIPDYSVVEEEYPMTRINPETGMAFDTHKTTSPLDIKDILTLMGTTSSKPVKSRQVQVTTPYAREDMLARRNIIGDATQKLDDALKAKESLGYSIANALAGIPQQQGYGSWLTDFARAFGGGWKSPVDAYTERAKTAAERDLKDLETALKFDKEMGDTIDIDLGYIYPPQQSNSDLLALSLLLGNNQ